MVDMQTQSFPFAVPAPDVIDTVTLGGAVTGVPLDGSATFNVVFPIPLLSFITGVNPVFNPTSDPDLPISWEIVGPPTLTGFVLKATGGPPPSSGITGRFSYTYTGQ